MVVGSVQVTDGLQIVNYYRPLTDNQPNQGNIHSHKVDTNIPENRPKQTFLLIGQYFQANLL